MGAQHRFLRLGHAASGCTTLPRCGTVPESHPRAIASDAPTLKPIVRSKNEPRMSTVLTMANSYHRTRPGAVHERCVSREVDAPAPEHCARLCRCPGRLARVAGYLPGGSQSCNRIRFQLAR